MKTRTLLSALLALSFALALTGCAWFLLGGAGGIAYTVTQQEDDEPVNRPPSVSIASPAASDLVSDRVQVRYSLMDAEGEPCDLRVRYSVDGGVTWNPATEVNAFPSEGVEGLTATPAGSAHVFVWNSFLDLGNANFPDAASGNVSMRLAIQATDAVGEKGPEVQTGDFRLYNGYVSTFFGGEAIGSLGFPTSVALRSAGGATPDRLAVGDEFQSRILDFRLDDGGQILLAGTGNPGYNGDNIPADTAGLTMPGKFCEDAAGNVYIADASAHRIRRIDVDSGFITTIVGTGERGYAGDGGAPGAALLDTPKAVAFDENQSILYIGDTGNEAVRAVNLGSSPVSVAGINVDPGIIVTLIGDPSVEWSQEKDGPVGVPGSIGSYASLTADGVGTLHAAYYDEKNGDLKYAVLEGNRWSIEVVDVSGDVGSHCDLAVDASGTVHISYYDADNGALKYALQTPGGWNTLTLDDSGDTGQYTSIGVDAATVPSIFISYAADEGNQVRVARWNGTLWQFTEIGLYGGQDTSLAVDGNGDPHVAWYHHFSGELMYKRYTGTGGWSAGDFTALGGSSPPRVPTAGSDCGQYCSLALDANDRPRIAFYVASSGDLNYTWWDGSQWPAIPTSVDIGGSMGADDVGSYCSLALNDLDHACIAYYDATNEELLYAEDGNGDHDFGDTGDGAGVEVDGHQTGFDDTVGPWCSLAVINNRPKIIYVWREWGDQGEVDRLRFATFSPLPAPGSWNLRLADGGFTVGGDRITDLEVDGDGNLFFCSHDKIRVLNTGDTVRSPLGIKVPPHEVRTLAGLPSPQTDLVWDEAGSTYHVVYSDPTDGTLRYASGAGTNWARETIPDPSASFGSFPSIARGASGTIYVAYHDEEADNLKVAIKSGGNWTIETPEGATASGVGEYASLALDGGGNPAVAYHDSANGTLKYAVKNGASWSVETIPGSVNTVGRFASLAFDGTGHPGIAYYDDDGKALCYVHYDGNDWTPSLAENRVRDDSEPCGMWTALDFDAMGYPHISHYGHLRNVLKYTHQDSTGWSTEVVDAFGDVGKHSTLAVDANDKSAWIAYVDTGRNKGWMAHKPGTHWERWEFGWNGAAFPALDLTPATGTGERPDLRISFSSPWDNGRVMIQETLNHFSDWTECIVYSPDFGESYGGDGRSAHAALFSEIGGIDLARYGVYTGTPPAYDALLVADSQNSRLRVINLHDPRGSTAAPFTVANATVEPGTVQTLLGDGDFGYDPADDGAVVDNAASTVEVAMPNDVTVDANGNIYLADSVNQRIRLLNTGASPLDRCGVSIPAGAIDTVAGGDLQVDVTASTFYPAGVDVDPSTDDVFVSDYIGVVFRVDPETRVAEVVAGSGAFGYAGDGGDALDALFWAPADVVVDRAGNLYILDQGNFRVRAVNLANGNGYEICGRTVDQGNIDTVFGTGTATGSIDGEGGDPADDYNEGGNSYEASVTQLAALAVDRRASIGGAPNPRGILYVSDTQMRRVRAVNLNPSGTLTLGPGPGIDLPAGKAVTVFGNGTAFDSIDGPGGDPKDDFLPGSGSLDVPLSRSGPIAVDAAGVLYVMDRDKNVLYAFNTDDDTALNAAGMIINAGTVERIAGGFFNGRAFNGDGIPARSAQFAEPSFLGAWRNTTTGDHEIYISDRLHLRIRRIDRYGIIDTWVGTGEAGFNGDGVPPANVLVNEPAGIAIHESGGKQYLYFVDSRGRRVRRQVK